MSKFTEAELEYMQSQQLGRLATVNKNGDPQVAAVTFRYNPELDTIDIGGYHNGDTQKFRNVALNGKAAFLIDDVMPPWKPRTLEIRGQAEALSEGGETVRAGFSPHLIRITPKRIIFVDTTIDPPQNTRRNV